MHRRKGSGWLALFPPVIALVFVLFFPFSLALGLEMPQTLIEQAGGPLFFPAQGVSVQALVADPLGVLAVRCYFRYRPDAEFVFVEMEQAEPGLYRAVLPPPAASTSEMEYLYLAVNGRRQVVRTPVVAVRDLSGIPLPVPATGREPFQVLTDLAEAPKTSGLGLTHDRDPVHPVVFAKRFGLTAGLYNTVAHEASPSLVQGYFGAYELGTDGRYRPLQGRLSLPAAVASVPEGEKSSATADPATDIIGPDIGGDTWAGLCYYGWGEASGNWYIYDPTPITAVITHESNRVTITLSTECIINFENIGSYFEGTMDWAGNMLLVDQRNPVQTWSSHWGPVTESEIKLGDYVSPPDPENNPFPDYYVIEVTREYPPPPPPPPPPPNLSFLPAVYHLLMAK